MQNIKIPGVVWVLLISVAIVAIETYLAPGYQLYAESAVVILMGLAKAANLGTKEIEDMLATLRRLQASQPESASAVPVPEPPSKLETWLVG